MKLNEAISNVENMPTVSIVRWLNFFDEFPQTPETKQHTKEQIEDLIRKMEEELDKRGEQEAQTRQHA